MPYFHCTKCHHEWESYDDNTKCDWCYAPGYVLEETTPLERMVENREELIKKLIKLKH